MKVIEYAKAHPVATGFILVVGGIIFIMIVRGSGGGESSAPSGPSDAEVMANATISAAQINAQAGVSAASLGAGVQLNSDNKAAEVAMRQLDVYRDLGLADIGAQERSATSAIAADQAKYTASLGALSMVKKKGRNSALQSIVTGQPVSRTGSGYGNSAAGIIGASGDIFKSITSLFSDQRLKENIRYAGNDISGRRVYDFNYKGSKTPRRGYMAQDFVRDEPHNVMVDNGTGYLKIASI